MRRLPRFVPLVMAASVSAQELGDEPPPPPPLWEELARFEARLEALEKGQPSLSPPAEPDGAVDLSGEELPSIGGAVSDHVLARPWYENLSIHGYAAFTYLDTGGVGTTEDGSFLVREASLFFDAELWKRTFLFTEVWLNRYLYGNGLNLGEMYLLLTDVTRREDAQAIGVKIGRFEIPFGEDYLRWDATETPFVTFSAADPYGMDEGVQVYGGLGDLRWITAVTNGANGSGSDDGAAKQFSLKLYGNACRDLALSASALTMGDTKQSAFRLGGSMIAPVGMGGSSSAGTSPSDEVNALCWELDAHVAPERRANLRLQLGHAGVDDDVDAFDRDLTWVEVEPCFRLRDDVELVARYSAIGTYDDDEGYRFAGKPTADGEALGYDTSVLRRLAGAVRWSVNPHVAVKAEVGHDWIDLIDGSPLDSQNDERLYFAFEIVGSF